MTFYTPEQLFREVAAHDLYYRATGGGLTFGGGEPLLHVGAISKLKEYCPDHWTIWVETSLYATTAQVATAATVFDHFLVDIKTTDPDIYRQYTGGGDVSKVLENLKLLLTLAGPEKITVRLPLIPGFVTEEIREASESVLLGLGIWSIDHLVYEEEIW